MPRNGPGRGTAALSITRNRGKICNAEGCTEYRHRISGYCRYHSGKVYAHGHPEGHKIPSNTYNQERTEVATFIEAHQKHPGIRSALQWFDHWMKSYLPDDPRLAPSLPALPVFNGLRDHGVTPQRILIEVVAIWLYSKRNPHKLPDDIRLTYAISKAVIRLKPTREWSHRQTITVNLKGIGRRIRDIIGVLCLNVIDTIQSRNDYASNLRVAMDAPFTGTYAEQVDTEVNTTYLLDHALPFPRGPSGSSASATSATEGEPQA